MGSFFTVILVNPIINILVSIYHLLSLMHIPYALGFSIIILTVIIRFILYPLTASQLKASQKMQKISPHIAKLKAKHKNDAKTLQAETMKLYKEHGVNPAAGCIPVIIQLPVIWALYSVLQRVVNISNHNIISEINKVIYFDAIKLTKPWDPTFFGIPLGQNPSHLLKAMPLILIVPILTGVLQYFQSKMLMPKKDESEPKKKDEKKEDDFAQAFQKQSTYIFPIMIGFFSYSFPIGLSLYWNTFTIFGILQQYKIQKASSEKIK